jgi:hypothetical protein
MVTCAWGKIVLVLITIDAMCIPVDMNVVYITAVNKCLW